MAAQAARQARILDNMALVTFVVNRFSTDRTNTLGLEREDAIGFGTEGLIQAIDKFDDTRGTSFASFAIRRIRGSILDAVRRQDPLPRSLRRNTRLVDSAGQELATQLGRWPTQREVAMRLGIKPSEIQEIQRHARSRFVSLETVLQSGSGEGGSGRWDPPDQDDLSDPAFVAQHQASLRLLQTALRTLSERDQSILRLRYGESKPFHEVGRLLGLSESRVCQLHKRILSQLRARLSETLEQAA